MNSPAESTPPLFRFFDAFLQERNIKWMLAAGMAILLGSSLMMVTSHWNELGTTIKYLILLGYVGVIYGVGRFVYHHLVLRKTGTVLMSLTIMLIPLSFIAWNLFVLRNWTGSAQETVIGLPLALGLLGVNCAFAIFAARRVFGDFLRSNQPTFLACYLLLCLAGALAPTVAAMGSVASTFASLLLWLVFLVGACKVNRHVFWLTEHHDAPRICGFLPILLLGAQFLGLFAANFSAQIPVPWMGLGLVLVAVPVLLTADSVAQVFQQRTGGLVRPLPWTVALPLACGTILCAAGLTLAFTQLLSPPHLPYALVPTAALSAIVMAVVARRTGQRGFVWAMLAGILLAYNFSPVFFQGIAAMLVESGAEAVHEERLPYAFYGLTYIPLITGLMAAAFVAARRQSKLLTAPLRQSVIGLSVLLLLASFTHPAVTFYPAFLVGGVMTVLFALQTALFQDRRLALLALGAWFITCVGAAPFARQVFQMDLSAAADVMCIASGAAVLFFTGHWLDGLLARISLAEPTQPTQQQTDRELPAQQWTQPWMPCQLSGLTMTVIASVMWLANFSEPLSPDRSWALAGMITALLIAHSLRWISQLVSALTYLFLAAVAVTFAMDLQLTSGEMVSVATLILLVQWILDYVFVRYPQARVTEAFATVNRYSSFSGLVILLVAAYLPVLTLETFLPRLHTNVSRICCMFITVWAFDAARRSRNAALTVAGCVTVLALASATLIHAGGVDAYQWLPALWTVLAVVAIPVVHLLRRRMLSMESRPEFTTRWMELHELAIPLDYASRVVLSGVALTTLIALDWPYRIAGILAVEGLLAVSMVRRSPAIRTYALAIANGQILAAMVRLLLVRPQDDWLTVFSPGGEHIWLPIAAAASVSVVAWQYLRRFPDIVCDDIALDHRRLCWLVAAAGLGASIALPALSVTNLALAAFTFALLVVVELGCAVRDDDEIRVWSAEALVAVAIGYFAGFHVISFGRGIAMFSVLFSGFACFAASHWLANSQRWRIFARPLRINGMWLPMAAVSIAVGRHVYYSYSSAEPAWLGVNGLAMLMAAGFYFWQGIEARDAPKDKRIGLLLLSAAIVNCALTLLWFDLQWTDPQLFMIPLGGSILLLVEMLRRDLPGSMHDPLRYVGALIILVSPTFDILGGSWIHLISLMFLSVVVMLIAMGSRVRVLMYAGTAFLLADLVAMVVRGSIDNVNLLWIAGIARGAGVVTFGALCENNRESILQRMRAIQLNMEAWN